MSSFLTHVDTLPFMPLAHALTRLTLIGLAVSLAFVALGAVALSAMPLARRLTAALRFRLLTAAFLLAVLLPLFPLLARGPAEVTDAVAASAPVASIHLGSTVAALVASLWLLLSVFLAVRLLRQAIHLRNLRRMAEPLSAQTELLVAIPCPVALSDHVDSPCLVGVLRPVILIPRRLWTQISSRQLEAVLAHEAAHLRRLDPWINLLQKLALVAFPLHPALHLLDRWLSRERELACDESVLQRQYAATDYAASLVDVAAFTQNRAAISLPFGLMRSPSELSARIERILRPLPRLHPVASALFTLTLTAGAATFTSLTLQHLPAISFAPAQGAEVASPTAASLRASIASPLASPNGALPRARMVEAAYRLPHARSVERSQRASAVISSFSQPYPSHTRAVTTAWHRPQRHDADPQFAHFAVATSVERSAREYAVVVVLTSVVTTTTDASMNGEKTGTTPFLSAQTESVPSLPASGKAQPTSTVQIERANPDSNPDLNPNSTRIYFSIVTTTLRLTPAQHARISPEWFARQL